jgi:hypothetical protein
VAAIVPTAAAPQLKAIYQANGAVARRAARRASRIHSRSINEPPRANIDPLPRNPSTPGLTSLEMRERELASHGLRLGAIAFLKIIAMAVLAPLTMALAVLGDPKHEAVLRRS